MNAKILIGLVVVLAGLGLGWYAMQGGANPIEETAPATGEQMPVVPTTPGETPVTENVVETTMEATEKGGVGSNETMAQVTVGYTDSGFSPGTVTVKKGTAVKFINQSSKGMWVASALHPTHQLLPGFDQLKSVVKGGEYEYTFTKVGTWKYHNHVGVSDTGSVVVTE